MDHLQALNTTLVELRKGQQDLEPAVREHRERLLALLQESGCQGCTEAQSRARALELGADFHQVRAPRREGGCSARCPGSPGCFLRQIPAPFPRTAPPLST